MTHYYLTHVLNIPLFLLYSVYFTHHAFTNRFEHPLNKLFYLDIITLAGFDVGFRKTVTEHLKDNQDINLDVITKYLSTLEFARVYFAHFKIKYLGSVW